METTKLVPVVTKLMELELVSLANCRPFLPFLEFLKSQSLFNTKVAKNCLRVASKNVNKNLQLPVLSVPVLDFFFKTNK